MSVVCIGILKKNIPTKFDFSWFIGFREDKKETTILLIPLGLLLFCMYKKIHTIKVNNGGQTLFFPLLQSKLFLFEK